MSDTNTLGYVMITIIGTLFFVGTGSIITDIITSVPSPSPSIYYRKPEDKINLSVINGSILSGIDVEDSQNDFDIDDDLLEG